MTNTTTKREMFNINRAMYIQQHWDEVKNEISPFCKGTTSLETMRKFFTGFINRQQRIDDTVSFREVTYRQKFDNKGRLFADGAVSLQCLARPIRHSLVDGIYVDLDIANAHPNILKQMMDAEKLDTHYLTKFTNNKAKYIKMLTDKGVSEDRAKAMYLIIINKESHKIDKLHEKFAYKLSREVVKAQKHFSTGEYSKRFKQYVAYKLKTMKAKAERNGEVFNKENVWNQESKWLNFLITENENKALDGIRSAFNDDDRLILCFDGAMVPLDLYNNLNRLEDGTVDFEPIQAQIMAKSGLDLQIKAKPFDLQLSVFKNGVEIPQIEIKEPELYNDYLMFCGKDKENRAEDVLKWANKCVWIVEAPKGKKIVRKKSNIQRFGDSIQSNTYMDITSYLATFIDMDSFCNIINPEFDATKPAGKKNPKYSHTVLGSFLKESAQNGKLQTFKSTNFSPHLGNPKVVPDSLNMFTEWPLLKETPSENFDFYDSLFYKHIHNIICDGDSVAAEHLIGQWADLLQDPLNMKRNAHLIMGNQGSGKSIIITFLMNVLGHENVGVINDVDRFFEKFNEDVQYKTILIFEELSENGSISQTHFNRLKEFITSPKMRVEIKGGASSYVDVVHRYIFLSNHLRGAMNARGDERITACQTNNSMAGNHEYFKPLFAEIKDKQFCVNSFHWLKNHKYDMTFVSKPYNTKIKQNMKVDQMNAGLKFIVDFIETRFIEESQKHWREAKPDDKMFIFPFPKLNELFKAEWKVGGHATLNAQLEDIGIKQKSSRQNAMGLPGTPKCINLHPPTVQELIRKAIGVPDFELNLTIPDEPETEPRCNIDSSLEEQIKILELTIERKKQQLAAATR